MEFVCVNLKILLINNKIFCFFLFLKYLVIVSFVKVIFILVLGGLFIWLKIKVVFFKIFDVSILLYKLLFFLVFLLILVKIESLLCFFVILLINFCIKIVFLILVLLKRLILLFFMYGIKRLIILMLVLKILFFVFCFLYEGVGVWIGIFLVLGVFFKLIGLFRILNILFKILLLIGILIGVLVL